MKLNTVKNDLQTNSEFESKEFGIGDASVVIEILRNRLYAHPIRTLVQEYISNGRDAIREAGNGGKLKVHSPTRFDSTFKVRDYGVGITPERMNDVFVMYGASTKRKTNGQTGGFGIGAKSAWSYTDSFTITTFVDGTKRSYIAHVGANSNGRLDLVETTTTDEPNGTEIQIAVKPNDVWSFKHAIMRCIYFWAEHEKPEVTGMDLADLSPKVSSLKISPEVEAFKNLPNFVSDNDAGMHLIIDGIVYSLESGYVEKLKELKKLKDAFGYGVDVALKIPNGIVEVSASREKIADSEKSRKALAALGERWVNQVTEHYKGHFKACKTVFDFAKVFRGFEGMLNKNSLPSSFKGFSVGHEALRNDKFMGIDLMKVSKSYHRRRRSSGVSMAADDIGLSKLNIHGVDLQLCEKIFFVDIQESKVNLNKRIRELLKTSPAIILINKKEPTEAPKPGADGKVDQHTMDSWTKRQPVSDKDFQWILTELEVKKISDTPLPVETKEEKERRKKEKGVIPVHLAEYSQHVREVNLLTNEDTFVYASLDYDRRALAGLKSIVEDETGATLCRLSKAAIDKIEDDKNFSKLEDFLKKLKVSERMRRSRMSMVAKNADMIEGLKKIKDDIKAKDVKEVLDAYEDMKSVKLMEIPEGLFSLIDSDKKVKEFIELDSGFAKLIEDKYPLINTVDLGWEYRNKKGSKIGKEIAFYINAKNS